MECFVFFRIFKNQWFCINRLIFSKIVITTPAIKKYHITWNVAGSTMCYITNTTTITKKNTETVKIKCECEMMNDLLVFFALLCDCMTYYCDCSIHTQKTRQQHFVYNGISHVFVDDGESWNRLFISHATLSQIFNALTNDHTQLQQLVWIKFLKVLISMEFMFNSTQQYIRSVKSCK